MSKPVGANWETWYRALKSVNREAYDKAIRYSEALSLKYNLPLTQAAEFERSHVMLACELLGVRP